MSCVLCCSYSSWGSLFGKRMFGTHIWQVLHWMPISQGLDWMLGWQVHHWEADLASSWLENLFCKCIVGKPMPDAVAAPGTQKDTKNTEKSLPEYHFWKPKCLELASWNPIFFPIRFWSQNGTTSQVHSNIFWLFRVPQEIPQMPQVPTHEVPQPAQAQPQPQPEPVEEAQLISFD